MAMNINQIFEYELHRKLSLRAKTINSEIYLLTNAFKFYDIDDTGKVKKEDFAKVFGKIGLNGITNTDLYRLFDIYDINKIGYIDYINFIEYMYDIAPYKPIEPQNDVSKRRILHSEIQQINEQRIKTPFPEKDNLEQIPERKIKSPIEPTFEEVIQNYKPLYKPITPLNNENLYKIKSYLIKDNIPKIQEENSNDYNYNKITNNNYKETMNLKMNDNQIKNCNFEDIRPQSTKIKKYFQLLLEQIKKKINLNNGLIYYTLLSKIIKKEDRMYKTISYIDFQSCIQESKISIENSIIKDFYDVLDITEQNRVSTEKILNHIRGFLNERRKLITTEIFYKLNPNNKNYCEINKIKNSFNVRNHPDVLKGKKSENQIINEFFFTFDTFLKYKGRYNQISLDDFIEYYSPISASIPNDEIFIEILNKVWSLNNNYQKLSRSNDFNYNLEKLNYENPKTPYNLKSKFTPVKELDLNYIGSHDKRTYSSSNLNSNRTYTTSMINGKYHNNDNNNNYRYQTIQPEINYQNENLNQLKLNANDNSNNDLINKLRSILLSRGTKSLFIIEKMLSMYDSNHTGKVDYNSFEKIIEIYKLPLSKNEISQIFKCFDEKNTGIIQYDNLIKTIVGNMPNNREFLIKQVYNNLILNENNNEVSISNLKNIYNASRHPEVIACKKKIYEIKNEFSDNLDVFREYIKPISISSDGFLNYNDFIKFYNQISLGISDDSYFNYLINNVWNLDNGDDKHYYNFGNNIFEMRYGGSSRFSNL